MAYDDRPIPGPQIGEQSTWVTLKLPHGWERDPKHPDRLIIRIPATQFPEALGSVLETVFGDLAEMAYAKLHEVSVLKALMNSRVD